jgi:electron transport complex protein RnfD
MIAGMQQSHNVQADPRRAVFVRERIDRMLLALLPGAALHEWTHGAWVALAIGGAIAWAMSLAPLKRMRNGTSGMPWQQVSNGFALPAVAVLMGALCVLWLPPELPWWSFAIAILLSIALMRAFRDRPGASPFHPAMVGCAIALVFAPHTPLPSNTAAMSMWIAAAYASGGIVLIVTRCIRWQLPLAILVGATLVCIAWKIIGGLAPTSDALATLLSSLALIGFFIAADPSSGCITPRARWLFGAGIGILSSLAILALRDGTHATLGMAGAVLMMNATAPWLDRICERPRHVSKRANTASP